MNTKFIKFKKTSKWKNITYLLIYESFCDENVGFTKLIKALKPFHCRLSLDEYICLYH